MNLISKETIYNYIFRIAYLIITFIAVPITFKYLGDERFGVWQTILTLIGFVALSNFGIGNGLRNKVTEYFSKKEVEKLSIIVSSAYKSITVISIIILIVAVPIIINFDFNKIYSDLTINTSEVSIAFIVTIIGFCINFIMGLITSIAYGIQKSHLVTMSQLLASIISLLLTIMVMKTSPNLVIISTIYAICNILVNVILSFMIFKENKSMIPTMKKYNKTEAKILYSIGIGFFILQIASLLMTTSDNFIIAKVIGASDVAEYSIVNKLFNMIPTLYSILLIQVWAQTAKDLALCQYENIKSQVKKLILLLIPIAIVLATMVITFDLITKIWLGKTLEVSKWLILLCALYSFLVCFNGVFVNVQNGFGKIKHQTISYIIAASIQIPLATFFINKLNYGVTGMMLTKVIIMLIPSVINSIHIFILLKGVNKKYDNCDKLCG
ncbi:MAG: lipopolysaccharide biosynthesis protein [Clostridium sp.]